MFSITYFCLASDARLTASGISFNLATEEAVKASEKEEVMRDSAVDCIAPACCSARDEEAHGLYSRLDHYVDRIEEEEVAREECLGFYEYHAVMATLLA